jgi:PAS domain S-box-containing protein
VRLERRTQQALAIAVVAAAYYGAAKIGLELSVAHGLITPVWPPTGVALAALLVLGPRLWPAIALGAFLANLTSDASAPVAASIAVGNTLEALVGYWLLQRVGFRRSLGRARDVLALAIVAAFVSTVVSATWGATTLALADSPAASPYGSAWKLWWLGDAMGSLLVAPLILVWAAQPRTLPSGRRAAEALVLLGLLAGTGAAVFLAGLWRYPYLLFPLLVWATLRFRQRGAATGSFVVAVFAVAGAVSGETPLGDSATTTVQVLQGLLAFVAVSLLVLGASLSERDEAEEALRHTARSLAEAQELAHMGSWEWEIGADRVSWSAALFRIFGLQPRGTSLAYTAYLQRVHPADRDRMRAVIERARADGRPFEVTHRIVLEDGGERVISGRGRVLRDDGGNPVRMVGTAQDVTERHHLETLRENILAAVSHELRTPLASIVGFALTLQQRGPELTDKAEREVVDELTRQSLRLERLLADLLDVDRLRHGRLRARLEPTDVSEVVHRVAAAADAPDGTRIEVDANRIVAEVDPVKVERIVENLIANAAKHTPPGSTIAVSVAAEDDAVLIRVDDDGPGIPANERREIFELFARGTLSPNAPGTGIGLALVAQFAALQGGRVWVEDSERGGASFRVLLPLRAGGGEPLAEPPE